MRNRLLAGFALALGAAGFAWLNGGQRVELHLGLFTLHSVPFPVVVLGAFLAGMLALFFAGLKSEIRTRRMLERYRQTLGADSGSRPDTPPGES